MSRLRTLVQLATADAACTEAKAAGAGWLSADERLRYSELSTAAGRHRYLAAHWLARRALAAFTAVDACCWRLHRSPAGRPLAARLDGLSAPHISLTHSGRLVACAVSNLPVGIDLEMPVHRRDLLAMAGMVCNESERRHLAALDEPGQADSFYRYWTLKEAWLKRDGNGIDPDRMRRLQAERTERGGNARTWQSEEAWLAVAVDDVARLELESAGTFRPTGSWRLTLSAGS